MILSGDPTPVEMIEIRRVANSVGNAGPRPTGCSV